MRKVHLSSITALLTLSACDPRTSPDEATPTHIDHVIVGVSDLERGIATLEGLTGVRPTVGGAHPGQGTRNALMSLGNGTYLELYAPNPAEPVGSPEVRELEDLSGLKPLGWAIGLDNAETVRSTLAAQGFTLSAPEAGSRARPDGSLLKWETFGFERFDDALAPFFISWKQPADLHPSRTSPSGCRLLAIHLQEPNPQRLAKAIWALRVTVTVAKASEQGMKVDLACPKGLVSLQ